MTKLPALMVLAASILAAPVFGAQIPRQAPEFVIQLKDGRPQLLSSYKGKTIVLAFLYTTCSHCQKTAGVLAQVQKEYEAKGVQVLAAVFDDGATNRVLDFHKSLGLNFPVGVSDTRTVLEYLQVPVTDPYFVPILVFVDKRGMIRSQYVGDEKFLGKQEENIRAELDKLIKGAPVAPATHAADSKKAPKS
jgi:peroxiredoxin